MKKTLFPISLRYVSYIHLLAFGRKKSILETQIPTWIAMEKRPELKTKRQRLVI